MPNVYDTQQRVPKPVVLSARRARRKNKITGFETRCRVRAGLLHWFLLKLTRSCAFSPCKCGHLPPFFPTSARALTSARAHTHTHKHHARTRVCIYIHTHTQTEWGVCVCVCMFVFLCFCVCACMCVCSNIYSHTCAHAHTRTHRHPCMCWGLLCFFFSLVLSGMLVTVGLFCYSFCRCMSPVLELFVGLFCGLQRLTTTSTETF